MVNVECERHNRLVVKKSKTMFSLSSVILFNRSGFLRFLIFTTRVDTNKRNKHPPPDVFAEIKSTFAGRASETHWELRSIGASRPKTLKVEFPYSFVSGSSRVSCT